jgi:hypothetical protein
VGGTCEFTGIVLVVSPELFPRFGGAWRKLSPIAARGWSQVLRLFRRPRNITVPVSAATATFSAGRISMLVTKNPAAPLEEEVDFLLDQDRKTQERLNALDEKIDRNAEQVRRERQAALDDLEERFVKRLGQERDIHIGGRLVGIGFLLVGVPLLAIANVL